MLTQIVRPMVRTQLRLLAGSQATRATLINTIAQWLGFLGVEAHVTQLHARSNQIQLSITVYQPDGCDPHDWQQIIRNLEQSKQQIDGVTSSLAITPQQQSKLQRLLAYVIQAGATDSSNDKVVWDELLPQLRGLGFEEETLLGIRSALKVPQSLEQLLEGLDADVAAIALPKAVSLAMLDRQVNASEDKALTALLDAIKQQ
jgi:hypothetical protein